MKNLKTFCSLAIIALLVSCSTKTIKEDEHKWLESLNDQATSDWVKSRNTKTLQYLQANPEYKKINAEVKKILFAKDKLAYPQIIGDEIYNFWRDEKNVNGIWRRTSLSNYQKKNVSWETVLDIDQLRKAEGKNWVWYSADCLRSEPLCLVYLSDGGKDFFIGREFNLKTKKFVENGFQIPEAKSRLTWIDKDTLIIGTNWGPGTLTNSNYSKIIKILKRGQPLSEAREIFAGESSDVVVSPWHIWNKTTKDIFLFRYYKFHDVKIYILTEDYTPIPIPIPSGVQVQALKDQTLFFKLRLPWVTEKFSYPEGSIIALKYKKTPSSDKNQNSLITFESPELVAAPQSYESFQQIIATSAGLFILSQKNVQSILYSVEKHEGQWIKSDLGLPKSGSIQISSYSDHKDYFFIDYESFLSPSSLYLGRTVKNKTTFKLAKQLPPQFDSKNLVTHQYFAKSKDGTQVPYYIVHHKNIKLNGDNPTYVYGYGGFDVSELPYYLSALGKVWFNRGGVFVQANIRGGGEFGPKWYMSGIREFKQNSYDDFIAVIEDTIVRKITSPSRLGITGGSNGGLLVGAIMTQRPDLLNAVVCKIPLLDMLNYHKYLSGPSWIDEYGNPDDPKMRSILLKYSPYHNLKAGVKYPTPFFLTSTKDDRVHPMHARKMAAKMEAYGYPYYYYENIDGGHGLDSNLDDSLLRRSLELTYMYDQLMKNFTPPQ